MKRSGGLDQVAPHLRGLVEILLDELVRRTLHPELGHARIDVDALGSFGIDAQVKDKTGRAACPGAS